jgi:hypothetical protein
VNVILRGIRWIVCSPLDHGQGATLKGHQIEEAAVVLERDAMLNLDQTSGSPPIFEDTLFDWCRAIGGADEQARGVGYGIPNALNYGAQVALVILER